MGSVTALSQSKSAGVGDWSFLSWMVIVGALKQGVCDGIQFIGGFQFRSVIIYTTHRCISVSLRPCPSNIFRSPIRDQNVLRHLSTPSPPFLGFSYHRCRCRPSSRVLAISFDTHFSHTHQGISGLACAYSLASSGHRVRVLEASPKGARKSYSGLRVPPNMSKILLEWGLGDELKAKTRPCRQAVFDDR